MLYEWALSTLWMQSIYNIACMRHIHTLVNSNEYTFTDYKMPFFLLGGLFLLGVIFFSLLHSMQSHAHIPILVFFSSIVHSVSKCYNIVYFISGIAFKRQTLKSKCGICEIMKNTIYFLYRLLLLLNDHL